MAGMELRRRKSGTHPPEEENLKEEENEGESKCHFRKYQSGKKSYSESTPFQNMMRFDKELSRIPSDEVKGLVSIWTKLKLSKQIHSLGTEYYYYPIKRLLDRVPYDDDHQATIFELKLKSYDHDPCYDAVSKMKIVKDLWRSIKLGLWPMMDLVEGNAAAAFMTGELSKEQREELIQKMKTLRAKVVIRPIA